MVNQKEIYTKTTIFGGNTTKKQKQKRKKTFIFRSCASHCHCLLGWFGGRFSFHCQTKQQTGFSWSCGVWCCRFCSVRNSSRKNYSILGPLLTLFSVGCVEPSQQATRHFARRGFILSAGSQRRRRSSYSTVRARQAAALASHAHQTTAEYKKRLSKKMHVVSVANACLVPFDWLRWWRLSSSLARNCLAC